MFNAFRLGALVAGLAVLSSPATVGAEICTDCIKVRVGTPHVVRGPFPDELDAPFSALRLGSGLFRGFTSNGSTYAIEAPTLLDMKGPRREVLSAGAPGSVNDCGRWLTSLARAEGTLVGLVHQEQDCNYNQGRTRKTMAVATSADDGLTWTDLGTVISGRDGHVTSGITGEGDCTMVDGLDGFLYAYCLRNSDWQTIVARADPTDLTQWWKYLDGQWTEPGLGGNATAIGFLGPGAALLRDQQWVATFATDPWFGGLRLSLSADKVKFHDLDEPLLTIDASDWDRPNDTDLIAYGTALDPHTGSNDVGSDFILSYIYIPPGLGFESRYLVHHPVSLEMTDRETEVQVGMALTRWTSADQQSHITTTGPLWGDRIDGARAELVAYMMTRAPDGEASIKLSECRGPGSTTNVMIFDKGSCKAEGFAWERTSGWLYAKEQDGTVPVYRCSSAEGALFASNATDCDGLGARQFLIGYGIAP